MSIFHAGWSLVKSIKYQSIQESKISSASRLELGSAVSTACLAPPAAEPQSGSHIWRWHSGEKPIHVTIASFDLLTQVI